MIMGELGKTAGNVVLNEVLAALPWLGYLEPLSVAVFSPVF